MNTRFGGLVATHQQIREQFYKGGAAGFALALFLTWLF
jgi:hypothetical protein